MIEKLAEHSAGLLLGIGLVLFSAGLYAQPGGQQANELLAEDEYRSSLEEVVVVGQPPEWRKPRQEEWRPERFELKAGAERSSRMEWFPKYSKEERDHYMTVQDRSNEKAEIQLFKWRF